MNAVDTFCTPLTLTLSPYSGEGTRLLERELGRGRAFSSRTVTGNNAADGRFRQGH